LPENVPINVQTTQFPEMVDIIYYSKKSKM